MFKKMNKKTVLTIILSSLILSVISFFLVNASASRSVTLTTYYPAPYGKYNDITITNKLGIGTTNPVSKVSIFGSNTFNEPYSATLAIGRRPDGQAATLGFWFSPTLGWHQEVDYQGDMIFWTYPWQRRITFKNSTGNVGIGTANPNSILNLYGSNPEERILESTSIGTASVGLGDGVNNPAITSEGLRILYESSTGHSYIRNLWSAGKLFFDTAGSNTRMTIDQSGNIGIGTTAPAAKLDVTSSRISSDTQIGDFVAPGSTAGTGYVTFGNGFVGWDYGAGVLGINAHSAGGPGGGICIKRVDNGHSNIGILTANPSAPLSFRPATEQKIKLYDSGAGVDTYGFGVEPSELRIATSDGGYITFRTGYYNGAKMTLNNNGSLWTLSGYSQGSDIRLKKNISTVNEALDKVLKLRGVIFEWKTKEYKERGFPKGRHYGVIAQEIEKILPEIVNTDSKGEKSVAYTEIIPVLIEAVKEQQKEIAGLKEQQKAQQKQITELNAQNKLLEQRLSALEKSIKVKRR